jgi:hypothetical protein
MAKRKIPSRKFPKTKKKIPSRKFPKTKKKIPSRKFPKSQRKIPSRKFAKAPVAADKQPDVQVTLGRPTDEVERKARVATLADQIKSVLPASKL